MPVLVSEQTAACDAILDWFYNSGRQVFRLFGPAGSGKSTIIAAIKEHFIDITIQPLAFTGAAVRVLIIKGSKGAETIHRYIYQPEDSAIRKRIEELFRQREETVDQAERDKITKQINTLQNSPQVVFKLRDRVEVADLIIVDESSFLTQRMQDDLCEIGKKILVVGDPFQLPPPLDLEAGCSWMRDVDSADVILREIHRQALDNPILALATSFRCGTFFDFQDDPRLTYEPWTYALGRKIHELAPNYDVVICGKHVTRIETIFRIRTHLGKDPELPDVGENVVCLRNIPNGRNGYKAINGAHYRIKGMNIHRREKVRSKHDAFQVIDFDLLDEFTGDEFRLENVHMFHFLGFHFKPAAKRGKNGLQALTPIAREIRAELTDEEQSYIIDALNSAAFQFTFPEVITCHKAQGSEFDRVLVLDEGHKFREKGSDKHLRWRYVAATRARERLHFISQYEN